jgi:hypothetical protein
VRGRRENVVVGFGLILGKKMQNKRIIGNGENRTLVVRLIRLVPFICLVSAFVDFLLPEYISSAT